MKQGLILVLMAAASCSVLQNNSFMTRADNLMGPHPFIYPLPYEKGTSHLVVQGYQSFFSHAGDFAIDFKMRPGTKVVAARDGVVVFVRESKRSGGVGKKYIGQGNGIIVKHGDDTYAHYWHLQYNGALVSVGDSVRQGQVIGLSGSTGFSAFPHLHFEVTSQVTVSHADIPVLFQTKKGIKFLQPLHWYKAL